MRSLSTLGPKAIRAASNMLRDAVWKWRLRRFSDPSKNIVTWTTRAELRQLYRLAVSCPAGATAVELGSYLGASTVFLAAGLKRINGRLICVDTWNNETMPEGERDTYDEFQQNVRRFRDHIVPIRKRSSEVSFADVGDSVEFVFIDGDHSYSALRCDFECVEPMLTARAIVGFHDSTYDEFPGVSRFIGESLASGQWFIAGNVESLTWLRRANHHATTAN